jgi:CheY-like chemotaxis protein
MSDHFPSPPSTDTMAPELLLAPVGYVVIEQGLNLVAFNHKAAGYGMAAGESIATYLEEESLARLQKLIDASANGSFEAVFLDGKCFESHFQILPGSKHNGLWLFDVSELRVVQHQLQTLKRPDRRLLHRLNNLISTTLGYSELVELMLEENTMLDGERLKAVRRYYREINSGLRQVESHVQREKQGRVPSDIGRQGKHHVLIVHSETVRLELLIELLQSQQFKVTSFTDDQAAVEFIDLNPESFHLAIIEEVRELASRLLEVSPSLNILVCTDAELAIQDKRIHVIPDSPLDINILMKAMLDIEDSN